MLKDMSSLEYILMNDLTEDERLDLFSEEYVREISMELYKERLNRNLTQNKFAKLLGVSQPMISKLESLEYNPTIKKLAEICYKLGITLTISLKNNKIVHDITAKIEEYFTQTVNHDYIKKEQEALLELNYKDIQNFSSELLDTSINIDYVSSEGKQDKLLFAA